MRKVILQELVTVDGYAAGPNGELDFFETISDYSEVDQDNVEALENVDAILLGAASYRMFVEYWPTAEGEIVAKAVNTIPKLVFSSTLERAPWGDWPEAQVVRGEATDEVAVLKRKSGKDIIVWGSLSLAQSLLTADLIDEVQLRGLPHPPGRRPPRLHGGHDQRRPPLPGGQALRLGHRLPPLRYPSAVAPRRCALHGRREVVVRWLVELPWESTSVDQVRGVIRDGLAASP